MIVALLSRKRQPDAEIPVYRWDIAKAEIDDEAIRFADYIIHLAGTNISKKKWTTSRKQLIMDSRVISAQLILDKIYQSNKKLKVFISASAIGYYGAVKSEKYLWKPNLRQTIFSEKLTICGNRQQICIAYIRR